MNKYNHALLLCGLLLAGCSDYEHGPEYPADGAIRFSTAPVAPSGTRSGAGGLNGLRELKLTSESGDSLTAYIEETAWDDNRGTRSTPVTKETIKDFEVYTFLEKGSGKSLYFNTTVTKDNNGNWVYKPVYYWPDEGSSLTFFGIRGHEDPNVIQFDKPTSENGPEKITYTVPDKAENQPDLMTASLTDCKRGELVSMGFEHLLAKVTFHIGADIQKGTIVSAKITNMASKGTYTGTAWTPEEGSAKEFGITPDYQVTDDSGNASGQMINGEEFTMMMLPQTLTDSQLVVEFLPEGETDPSNAKTLSAALPATTLVKGGSYKIHINIKPDFDFKLDIVEGQPDSHYTRFKVSVTPKNYDGDWVVEVDNPAKSWCSLRKNIVGLEENGYWIRKDYAVNYKKKNAGINDYADPDGLDYTRLDSLNFKSTESGNFYVFMEERRSTESRPVKLLMYPTGKRQLAVDTILIQPGLLDINGTMWESVEESDEGPWGFCWNRKIRYIAPDILQGASLTNAASFSARRKEVHNKEYGPVVNSYDYSAASWTRPWDKGNITFEYNKATPDAYDELNGLQNTITLKTTVPAKVLELENILQSYSCLTDSVYGNLITTEVYASADAMKRNAFEVKQTEGKVTGATSYVYDPVIKDDSIKWYLPAIGEFPTGAIDLLPEKYWSSTGLKDGENARSWSNGVSPKEGEHRVNVTNSVRAVRVKP